jgi:apolipoprotein N-acyltransferase
MSQAVSLIWLAAGCSLFGVITRTAAAPFTWLSLLALLHASRSMPAVPGTLALCLGLFVALASGSRGILPLEGPGYLAIVALNTCAAVVPFVIDRAAGGRLEGFSTLLFPAAWVAAEFLRSRFTPAASWGSIAYTQYGYLPLMQVAAFVGIWGISFLIAWCASTVEWAWVRGFEWTVVRVPLLAYALVFGGTIVGATVRVVLAPTDRPVMRTATLNRPVDLFVPGEMTRIAQGRLPEEERERLGAKLRRLHDWFLEGSQREARAGARLVVWPEQNLLIFKEDEAAFLERAARLAIAERVYLAMGMGTIWSGEALPFENKLVLVDPAGHVHDAYLKSHPVPGWEASIMKPGDGRLPVVSTPDGRLGEAICFDADFPEFMRQAAAGSADILILPVNDSKAFKNLHFHMAAFRAIETGIPLVRAAASGLSAAFDPWGRVLGVSDYFAAGDRTMTVQVPMGGIRTLYSRTGDLFAWLCVSGVLAALIFVLVGSGLSVRGQTRLSWPPSVPGDSWAQTR